MALVPCTCHGTVPCTCTCTCGPHDRCPCTSNSWKAANLHFGASQVRHQHHRLSFGSIGHHLQVESTAHASVSLSAAGLKLAAVRSIQPQMTKMHEPSSSFAKELKLTALGVVQPLTSGAGEAVGGGGGAGGGKASAKTQLPSSHPAAGWKLRAVWSVQPHEAGKTQSAAKQRRSP